MSPEVIRRFGILQNKANFHRCTRQPLLSILYFNLTDTHNKQIPVFPGKIL